MSKKKTTTRCLVIDASVAKAAGSLESTHPAGTLCRDFLLEVLDICHRMAWTKEIKLEWKKHESAFSRQWRLSMLSRKKVQVVEPAESTVWGSVHENLQDANILAILLKDWHLIEAALAADNRIVSLDDQVRDHLAALTPNVDALRSILWVNPTVSDEKAIEWLVGGAPDQKKHRLSRR